MSVIPRGSGSGSRQSNLFDPFSLDLWDPIDGFPFGSSSSLARPSILFPSEVSAFVGTHIDWKETPEAHVFKADIPGLKKEEVKVEIEDGRFLQISGERKSEEEENTDTWHRVERSRGKFLRRFRLPETARVDQVRAAMEDGVLTVTVPKEEEIKNSDVRSIEISG
ncbi:18.1 kDa class I heat shock protein-like [Musa acuminata AAA Group]|uniref:SHSP domain-containing protein n=1 Tax=Musa acuminata subsp. malaccensis TaxID=214687 RepID=A0A804JVW0_MUSAM|nr:PREDICTED: 18.1 kDa class I heat shock protein-like [Musa acuminata subsp. malaccensis]